jgi:hypothetical protein
MALSATARWFSCALGAVSLAACDPHPPTKVWALGADGHAVYVLQGVYFNPSQYRSAADCLTAAYRMKLPAEVCAGR